MQDSKIRAWTRFSIAALLVAVLAGITLGGAFIGAQDEPVDSPKQLDAATKAAITQAVKDALADAEKAKPQPRRTAYVNFLTLLKSDKPLAIKQQEIAEDMERTMADIEKRWGAEIKAQQAERDKHKPDTNNYRQAMQRQLEAARRMYEEKLQFEQLAKADLHAYGIERFKALKNLAGDIATKAGYNEVLNIVGEIERSGAGGEDAFQALQQELLISPVLYFEAEHDISKQVQAAADKLWGSNISIKPFVKDTGKDGVQFTVVDGKEPVKRNADGEIEIKLGTKGSFAVQVLEKEVPAEGDKGKVRWGKRGFNVGDLSDAGEYTAPAAFPVQDTFTITARSMVDPTVTEEVTIRLVDAEGKRMPPKKTE